MGKMVVELIRAAELVLWMAAQIAINLGLLVIRRGSSDRITHVGRSFSALAKETVSCRELIYNIGHARLSVSSVVHPFVSELGAPGLIVGGPKGAGVIRPFHLGSIGARPNANSCSHQRHYVQFCGYCNESSAHLARVLDSDAKLIDLAVQIPAHKTRQTGLEIYHQ